MLPVVERLAQAGERVSVDTTKLAVARAALAAGATIVNDVSAFRFDPGMADSWPTPGRAAAWCTCAASPGPCTTTRATTTWSPR